MDLNRAQDLAISLMTKHGLLQAGWGFKFDRAVNRGGVCRYTPKIISISRSITLLNSEADIRNTLLHEIAHALAGHRAGHGPEWKRLHRSIGGDASRTHNMTTPEPRWIGMCPNCKRTIKKERRKNTACGTCCRAHNGGKYADRFAMVWVENPQRKRLAVA